jgi:hypothetical protein
VNVSATARSRGGSLGASNQIGSWPQGELHNFAIAEAHTWGLDLKRDEGGVDMLVLKSPAEANAVLVSSAWGEPVSAVDSLLDDANVTVFPLNRLLKLEGMDEDCWDQLCVQVPKGSPLYHARLIPGHDTRGVANAKLHVNDMGVISVVALLSSIDAGIPLSIAPPCIASVVALQPPDEPVAFEPQPHFVVHLQMFKVSPPPLPRALFNYKRAHVFLIELVLIEFVMCLCSLLANRFFMWGSLLQGILTLLKELCYDGLPTYR